MTKTWMMALSLLVVALAGCTGPSDDLPRRPDTTPPGPSPPPTPGTTPGRTDVALNGAGATFPFPLISKWSSEYHKLTGAQVNYQSIGSGGGIRAITDKTVDFAGSDAPLNEAQRASAPGLVHIPETLGAVTLVYNLPGAQGLKLTGAMVADIFLGKVKRWNDPGIVALNPNVSLPTGDIFTVHRSDGSGTTFVFTDYLSKVSPEWSTRVGKGTAVSWPSEARQVGAKGNEGVAGVVQGNPHSIGYVELSYASIQKLPVAQLQNRAGNWITPSLDATAAAAAGASASLPAGDASWEGVSLTDAAGADAYPIASFTYFLVYKDLSGAYGAKMTRERAAALVDFLDWAVHAGQQYSSSLQYPPLPEAVVALNEQTLRTLTHEGQPLRP